MFRKLRWQIIIIEVAAFFVVTMAIIATININSYYQMKKSAHQILNMLDSNNGELYKIKDSDEEISDSLKSKYEMGFNLKINEETRYTTRYFYAKLNSEGEILSYNLDHVASISADDVEQYVSKALAKSKNEGKISRYWYLRSYSEEELTIYFVDFYTQNNYLDYMYKISLLVAGICMVFVCIVVYYLSGLIIRPMEKNLEQQKRFITDASHEIKTPLAAISANVDVLELVSGEKEITGKIRKQVNQLSNLVNEMLQLTRMSNKGLKKEEMEEICMSALVEELVEDFRVRLESDNRQMETEIGENIRIVGNRSDIHRLVSVLMDNAVKYCSPEGKVVIRLKEDSRSVRFYISNSSEKIPEKELAHLFDRFYRTDSSRSRQTGSYGIGLSIAKAIVDKHKGKIRVKNVKEGVAFEFTLPAKAK